MPFPPGFGRSPASVRRNTRVGESVNRKARLPRNRKEQATRIASLDLPLPISLEASRLPVEAPAVFVATRHKLDGRVKRVLGRRTFAKSRPGPSLRTVGLAVRYACFVPCPLEAVRGVGFLLGHSRHGEPDTVSPNPVRFAYCNGQIVGQLANIKTMEADRLYRDSSRSGAGWPHRNVMIQEALCRVANMVRCFILSFICL